jgi:hypothetical protein
MDREHELNGVVEDNRVAADNGSERHGKVGWAILWLLGVPLPILLVLYFLTGGGCNGG